MDAGERPVGAVFAHHLKMSPDTFDFELGVRVSAPAKAAGRVKPGQLPAVKVARTVTPVHQPMSVGPLRVTGGCRRQVDGTAGPPSAPELPSALRQLRLVPGAAVRRSASEQRVSTHTPGDWRSKAARRTSYRGYGKARNHARQSGRPLFASGASSALLNASGVVGVGSYAIWEAPWSPESQVASNVVSPRSSPPM